MEQQVIRLQFAKTRDHKSFCYWICHSRDFNQTNHKPVGYLYKKKSEDSGWRNHKRTLNS